MNARWSGRPLLVAGISIILCTGSAIRADIVGHWAFDETSQGKSTPNSGAGGAALDGKFVGDARLQADVSDGTVTRASALALDGRGDWVRIDHPVTTFGDGHSFTVAAWVKTTGAKMALLGKDDVDGKLENNEKIFFVKEGFGDREFGFVACSQEWLSTNAIRVNDGKWHHVAVVYDAMLGTKQVLVDGSDQTTETSWRAGADSGSVLRIGMSDWPDAGAFSGHVDDLVIYDQALLPEQIRVLIEKGPQPFDPLSLLGEVSGGDVWENLIRLSRVVRERRTGSPEQRITDADVQLGTWYCVGPMKDTPEGLHLRSFATVFPPEKQVLAVGGTAIDLTRTWPVKGEAVRRWQQHPEWTDGYVNPLPVGPPPMKNETCYLYRTITARRAIALPMNVFALDNIQAWLNGESVGTAHNPGRSGSSRFPAALMTTLRLRPGENRLLVKITSMHGAHGFAFAMPPLTPSNPVRPGAAHWEPQRFYPGNEPWVAVDPAKGAEIESLARRYEEYCLSIDQIDPAALPASQHAAYVAAILRRLALPGGAAALLPEFEDNTDLAQLRELHFRACRFADAQEKVRQFNLDISPLPMYDPARLRMADVLASSVGASASGATYLAKLDVLGPVVEKATDDDDEASVLVAARAIDDLWQEQARSLPPIAFIRCPAFAINAISPYIARGASPASICVLDPQQPRQSPRVIYDDPTGAIFDMNASYDGESLFFSARRKGVEGGWHIYEIGTDG
ncbi:MAG: LamG domain-containing protein, partial [Planctomycetes bacterium]|nr:LamG domain-containing protein [Planctomycetota bacterium]